MKRIGYIGLGLMGKAIASNLLRAGFELTVHNRSRAAVQDLVSLGASEAESPQQVAVASELVITNLPDSPDVEAVVLGSEGVLEGASEGMIYVDNSTIKPETARSIAHALAKKSVSALDAPVSGGDVGAKDGTLAIMVGGPKEVFVRALPIFEAMGKTITHVGESGAGQVAKACNQVMVAAQMVAMGELLMLAQRAGVSPAKVVEAIRGGAAQCWTLDMKPPRLFAGERGPGFKAHMMHKDLGIVLDTARSYGMPMPSAAGHMQLYEAMLQLGMRDLDNSAVLGVLETLVGEELQTVD
ncbi:MAG: NAD-binding protein [Chloroflexi bacterium]|nr:NAD-binding protein [Chloroflexota bacterium]MCI0772897.1 NAD-binding protein [Chloroflexota bacterium]MCI0805954.1 NAD-binding protein [Chloroflexota bacterium]MCI0827234.1 NAD-binding protein [Chloroflexota bacterium]MCI0853163.1 NAD-binding protein [Chloroflexota bacterium]